MLDNTNMVDHNGKPVRSVKGKNIRISDTAWDKIRKYCFRNGLKMGKFTEDAALELIKSKKKA